MASNRTLSIIAGSVNASLLLVDRQFFTLTRGVRGCQRRKLTHPQRRHQTGSNESPVVMELLPAKGV